MPQMFGGWEGKVREGLSPSRGRWPIHTVQDDIGAQSAVNPVGGDDPLEHEKGPENAGDRERLDKAKVCDEGCWIDAAQHRTNQAQAPAHVDGSGHLHDEDEDEPCTGRKEEATLPVKRTHGRVSVVLRRW